MQLPITLYEGQAKHIEFIQYPDGQHNCVLDMEYFNDVKLPIHIKCSIRNFIDLEKLLCIIAALCKQDYVVQTISFYYLFGMRSDRSFRPGMPNYFRDVLAPIINALPGTHEFFFPHGTIVWNYFKPESEFFYTWLEDPRLLAIDAPFIRIAGDESAYKEIPCQFDAYFKKTRKNGQITSLSLRNEHDQNIGDSQHQWRPNIFQSMDNMPFLIIDDLCDGGATFEAEADLLQLLWPKRERYLFVAHGLFTKGFDRLLKIFNAIYTTNSYQSFSFPNPIPKQVKVIKVI